MVAKENPKVAARTIVRQTSASASSSRCKALSQKHPGVEFLFTSRLRQNHGQNGLGLHDLNARDRAKGPAADISVTWHDFCFLFLYIVSGSLVADDPSRRQISARFRRGKRQDLAAAQRRRIEKADGTRDSSPSMQGEFHAILESI